MIIKTGKNSDNHAWDTYVLNHPSGTVFHLTAWKKAIEKSFGHRSRYLIAEENGKICGMGKERSCTRNPKQRIEE